MAILYRPPKINPMLPVFFNVEGRVGAVPSHNHEEDVYFVQHCLMAAAKDTSAYRTPAEQAAYDAVALTGRADDNTIAGIRAAQTTLKRKYPGTTIDGRVSPAVGYHYGGGWFTIVALNSVLERATRSNWPRLDKVTGCPAPIRALVMREVVGTDVPYGS